MLLDLTDLYDKGLGNDDPPPETSVQPKKQDYSQPVDWDVFHPSTPSEGGNISPVDPTAYTGYLNEPFYEGKGNLDERRGLAQSGWDKLGNFAVQTLGKTITQFTEGLGYMGTLVTQWGDDRNYENGLTAASKGANDWLDKNFPLYRHNTGTWALNDASWWLQNAQGLISSVAAFGGEGFLFSALAKGLRIGEGVEALANLGKRVNKVTGVLEGESIAGTLANAYKIGQKSSKLFTAGMLAYTEGAMAGKRIYDNVYQAQFAQALKDGKSLEAADDWARHQGAQAAATGVQLNTMVNTAFGFMGGVGEFFNHEKNAVISAAKKNLFMTAAEADLGAEALPTFLKRLGTETAEKLKLGTHKSWGTVAKEAVAEGMEELTNNWAENTATEHGKKGENLGFIEQLGTLKDYFTTKGVLDADGALNFVMGAVLGPIQHGVASHLPMHRQIVGTETKIVDGKEVMVDKDGEATDDYEKAKKKYLPGKFGTNLVTSRQVNEFGANEYFKDVKAGIEADYKKMSDIQASIKESIADGNFIRAEQFRKELFNATNTNAVAMGFAGNLVDTYRSFKNVDNTKTAKVEAQEQVDGLTNAVQQAKDQGQDTTELEAQLAAAQTKLSTASNKTAAMELNLTDGIDNNDYKDMADKAIEHLENLQKIHDGVLHKYGSPDNNTNMVQGHVSNQIFNKLGNLYLMREDEKVLQKELDEADNSVASNLLGDVDNSADLEVYSKRVSRLKDAHENILGKLDRIAAAIKLNKYSDVMDLIKEHGANGVTEADAPKAIKELQNKLLDQQDKLAEDFKGETENLVNTPMYEKWAVKNPKKNFDDFLTQVIKERRDSAFQRQTSLELENLRSRIKTHEEFVREIQESKTLASIKAKTERNFKNLQKELDAEKLAALKNKEARKQAEVARRDYNIKLMKELQVRYKREMTNLTVEKNNLVSDLKELAEKLKNFKYDLFSDNAAEFEALMNKKAELETNLERIQNRVTTLQTLWNEAAEIIVESSQPVEENPVVAEATTEPSPSTSSEDEYFVEDEPVEPDEAKPTVASVVKKRRERKKKALQSTLLKDLIDVPSTYRGMIGTLTKTEGGRYEFITDNQIIELTDVTDSSDYLELGFRIETKPRIKQYKVTSIEENSTVINGIAYTIHSDLKGNIVGLEDFNGQMHRNEKLLIAVEIERNRLGLKTLLDLEPTDLDTQFSLVENDFIVKLLTTIYEYNMTSTVDEAINKLTEQIPLNNAEQLQLELWVFDALDRIERLLENDYKGNEHLQNAFDSLLLMNTELHSLKPTQYEPDDKSTNNSKPSKTTKAGEVKNGKTSKSTESIKEEIKLQTEQVDSEILEDLSANSDTLQEIPEASNDAKPPEDSPEIVEETPPVEPTDTPKQDYFISILKSSTTPSLLINVYNELEEGKKVSLNALDNADLGGLTSPQVVTAIHEALTELGYVLADLEELEQKAENIDTSFEDDGIDLDVTDVETEPEPPITTKQVSDGFETNNPRPTNVDHSHAKSLSLIQDSPAGAMAQTTFITREIVNEITGDVKTESVGALNPELHPDIVDPTQLLPNTPLTTKIDSTFEGSEDALAFAACTDKDGLIREDAIGEVPIGIYNSNGKVSYVHRVGWIEEPIPGASSENKYKNCRDVLYDSRGNIIAEDNVAAQVAEVMKLRTAHVLNYNAGIKAGFHSKVKSKSEGNIQFQSEYSPASSNLPTVALGKVTGDGVIAGIAHMKINWPLDMSDWDNRTVAMIPMNNGTHTPVTLLGSKLKDVQGAVSTLIRVTEIHLDPKAEGRQAEAEQILAASGFDVRNLDGYRNFIIQYFTHFNAEGQLDNVKSGIILDATKGETGETISRIVIARKDDGRKQGEAVRATLVNGKLSDEFKAQLRVLAGLRFKSDALENTQRGIKGFNSQGDFNEVLYNSKTEKWEVTPCTSYTDYAKKFLYSNVKSSGVVKTSEGKNIHVFSGNPVIKFDMSTSNPVKYDPKLAMEDDTNVAALNAVNGTNNPVPVVGTQADQAPVTLKDVEKVYDKLYNDLCEAGDYDAADALKSPSNTWDKYRTTITHDMIESKIKCG